MSLRDNELEGRILGQITEGMIQDTDTSDGFTNTSDLLLLASLEHVAGMADDHLALGSFVTTLDTRDLAISVVDDFIDIFVEHESTSINGAHSRETFGDTTKTIDGIDEGRVSVSTVRVHVELNSINSFNGGSLDEGIISVKSNSMTDEIDHIGGEIELLDQSSKRFLSNIQTYKGLFKKLIENSQTSMSLGVCGIVFLNIDEKIFASVLFKESHQVRLQSFFTSSGNLIIKDKNADE